MASHWTSKNAILRDLSVAQGREVPVEIVNPVTSNEKPPALNYTEETEEEFYDGCVGSGDFEAGPDLQLIQQMLNMVREVEITDIEEKDVTDTEMVLEISKANAQSILQEIEDTKKEVKKPKKKRNVAVASLIESYGDNLYDNENNEKQSPSPKLLKPDDFMSNTQNNSPIDSVNNNGIISNKIPVITSPISMFKKKSPNKNADNTSICQKKDLTSTTVPENLHKPGSFVPSSHAGERYKTYLEKSKLQEQVKEDIWVRAERQMKEIDAKRREESLRNEVSTSSSSQESEDVNSSEAKGMDFVRLPQHRHLLTGECTVCKVLCTHRKDEPEQTKDCKDIENNIIE